MTATDEPNRYSHPSEDGRPAVLVSEHLHDVADRIPDIVPATATTPQGDSLEAVVRTVALVHDAGKASTWFQQHIEIIPGDPPSTVHTHHSLFGAFLAAYALDQQGHSNETILAGTHAVLRHHGMLGDCAETLFVRASPGRHSRLSDQRDAVIKQVEDIDENVPELATTIVADATGGKGTWSEYVQQVASGKAFHRVRDALSHSGLVRTLSRDLVPDTFYETTLLIWGALTLADKTSAAGTPSDGSPYDAPPVTFETLDEYVTSIQEGALTDGKQGELNDWRREAREQVLETVRTETPTVATLTLPTGLGKTLTGMSAATALRDTTDRERIIYALPFTSIIDQTGDVLTTIFDSDGSDGRVLLHHHLENATATLGKEFEDTDELAAIEGMLGESWRASIVLTTFVQLFESLTGPRNTQSMKLPALHDSVIILDEPQSLPHSWWPLVRRLIDILTKRYNAAVIAMTATQPKIFTRDTIELVRTHERFYRNLDRVTFHLDDSVTAFPESEAALTFDKAASRLNHRHHDSILAVCNTIASAEALYESTIQDPRTTEVGDILSEFLHSPEKPTPNRLAENIEDKGGRPVVFLSTRIRPRDRLLLIKTVKKLTNRNVPLLCVSTQLIEAGVDISFDRVYRDFAPIDSIVQAAGRCNRSYDGDDSVVTVWWLRGDPESMTTPGEAVYNLWGESLLSVTAQSLQAVAGDSREVSESTLTWGAVADYYDRIAEVDPGNRDFVKYVNDARADKLAQTSLIDERRTVEIVVCRTKSDKELVEHARDSFEAFEFDDFDKRVDSLRDIQISIPVYPGDDTTDVFVELPPLIPGEERITLRVLDSDQFGSFFDSNLGVITPESAVEGRFL